MINDRYCICTRAIDNSSYNQIMIFIFLLVSIAWFKVIQVITHALTMLRNDDNRLQPREYAAIDKCSGHSYIYIQPLYST